MDRGTGVLVISGGLTDGSDVMESERRTTPLTSGEMRELVALAGSTELREDLPATVRNLELSFDEYIAFATSVARLSNHPRRPFRPVNDNLFKL